MSQTWDTSGFESPEDLDGYQFPKEGQYHLAIQDADHESDKAHAANGLRIAFEVLNGNIPGQEGLSFQQTFKWPSAEHKDGGEFVRKLITKLLLATGYMHPSQLGKKQEVEWTDLVGRQIVAQVKHYKRTAEFGSNKGRTYEGAEIDGLKFWHVGHEGVASVPKDAEALGLRPADAAGPEDGKGELVGAGAPANAPANSPPTANGAGKGKDKFANL